MSKHQYSVRQLTADTFKQFFDAHHDTMFDDTHSYDFRDVLSTAEKEQIKSLKQAFSGTYKLYLGIFDEEDNMVGWSWGLQESATTFYMINSAVLKPHRRRGCYALLLQTMIDILSEKGFQLIYSRHCSTNNSVIIPKLKAGFVISKMELDDRFGVLIHLHYYTNKDRLKIVNYRSGQSKPNAQLKSLFRV